jgi:hypothetical protein
MYSPESKTAVTASLDGMVRIFETPLPLGENVEAIKAWVPLLTNLNYDVGQNLGMGVLDPESLQRAHRRLQSLGGPPGGPPRP